jgi:hypothetical protein
VRLKDEPGIDHSTSWTTRRSASRVCDEVSIVA